MIFVNLPVSDLATATRFYEAMGCRLNPRFSNEEAASMVWSDAIVFHLLVHASFSEFTPKPIADAHRSTEVLLAVQCESRSAVDTLAEAAAQAGGQTDIREKQDLGFMYARAVEDPDGHILELVWMDPTASDA
ncbi:VOC family protein [Verticiella sediminum]